MKKLGVLLAVLMVTCGAFAQDAEQSSGESSFGVIIYAEGEVVSVIRDRRRREYDAFTGELLGFAIYPGDIIQTDSDTYIEIQFLPSRSVVKVAENTSFTVQQISAAGDGVFNLAYGRLRARVSRLTGQDPFEIRGVGATAGVRGTDFGVDVIILPAGGASLTRIYCFEGEVQVEVAGRPAGAEPIIVAANQMVTATTLSPTSAAAAAVEAAAGAESEGVESTVAPVPVPEVESILPAISEFWQREDFVAEPADAESVLEQFPRLRTDAIERLGDVSFLGSEAPAPGPEPEVEPVSAPQEPIAVEVVEVAPTREQPVAVEAAETEGEAEPMDPERLEKLIRTTKVTGYTMTAVGLLTEVVATTFFIWGDQILPNWPPASDRDVLIAVAASGGVFLIGGILSLLFSLQLSR